MRILRDTLVAVLNQHDDVEVVAEVSEGGGIVPTALRDGALVAKLGMISRSGRVTPCRTKVANLPDADRGPSVGEEASATADNWICGDYLGVSRATVERLVYRGELPIVKLAGSTRYDVEELDGYIEVNRCRIARGRLEKPDLIERKGEGLKAPEGVKASLPRKL